MLKETGYQEKIVMLKPWLVEIIDVVKKDLRNEHLKMDKSFCRRHFLGKNPAQIHAIELAPAYEKEIAEGNISLGEFISTRWLLKNTDVYGYFENKLKVVSEDFEKLDELPLDLSQTLVDESVKQFGAKRTYLFSVLNSVVFPKTIYEKLEKQAKDETKKQEEQKAQAEENYTLESLKKRYEREFANLKDRYEKKFNGLEKKYIHDTETLKKQIAALQRKLSGTAE